MVNRTSSSGLMMIRPGGGLSSYSWRIHPNPGQHRRPNGQQDQQRAEAETH